MQLTCFNWAIIAFVFAAAVGRASTSGVVKALTFVLSQYLEDKREDYQNCSFEHCLPHLYTVGTHVMSSSYSCTRNCWLRCSLGFCVCFSYLGPISLICDFMCFQSFVLSCQYQCKWLPGKTPVWNDLLRVERDVKLYSLTHFRSSQSRDQRKPTYCHIIAGQTSPTTHVGRLVRSFVIISRRTLRQPPQPPI